MSPSYNFEIKRLLQNIPTDALVAELASRGEPIGNSDELPEGIIKEIENEIASIPDNVYSKFDIGFKTALEWVLSLRKPEEK